MGKLINIYGETLYEANGTTEELFMEAVQKGVSLKAIDAEGINLSNQRITNLIAPMGKFSGANLDGAVIESSNLQQADFNKASANNTQIVNCDLSAGYYADLDSLVGFTGIKGNGILVKGCNIGKSVWRGSNLENAKFIENKNCSTIDFSFSKVDKAEFFGSEYIEADFSHLKSSVNTKLPQKMTRCRFNNTVLKSPKITGATLFECHLEELTIEKGNIKSMTLLECKGEGMKFILSTMEDCMLYGEYPRFKAEGTNFINSKFDGNFFNSIWENSELINCIGKELNLSMSSMDKVKIERSDFASSKLQFSNFNNTDLSKTNLNNCEIYQTSFTNSPVNNEDQLRTVPTAAIKKDAGLSNTDGIIHTSPSKSARANSKFISKDLVEGAVEEKISNSKSKR